MANYTVENRHERDREAVEALRHGDRAPWLKLREDQRRENRELLDHEVDAEMGEVCREFGFTNADTLRTWLDRAVK